MGAETCKVCGRAVGSVWGECRPADAWFGYDGEHWRLGHAREKARAEKAEAERAQLRADLTRLRAEVERLRKYEPWLDRKLRDPQFAVAFEKERAELAARYARGCLPHGTPGYCAECDRDESSGL